MVKKIFVLALVALVMGASCVHAGLFSNKKIDEALQSGKIKIGMTKQELINEIGYPPEGKPKQSSLFYRFAQSKVTAAGKEESWTYQMGATVEGVRSITFKIVDDKVQEYNEWLDTVRK